MRRRRSTYLPRVMRNDHHVVGTGRLNGHPTVGIKRQLRSNSSPPHRLAKTGTDQLGTIHTIFGRNWTIKQDTPDLYTDREDVSILGTKATDSDVTNLITPGPITTDGLCRRCAVTRPAIEAPHTLSASQTRCWITNSPRGSSLSILNHTTEQPTPQCVLGNVVISKKILRTRKVMEMHSNEMEECVHIPS